VGGGGGGGFGGCWGGGLGGGGGGGGVIVGVFLLFGGWVDFGGFFLVTIGWVNTVGFEGSCGGLGRKILLQTSSLSSSPSCNLLRVQHYHVLEGKERKGEGGKREKVKFSLHR